MSVLFIYFNYINLFCHILRRSLEEQELENFVPLPTLCPPVISKAPPVISKAPPVSNPYLVSPGDSPPSNHFSCTQDAIDHVQGDIDELKGAYSSSVSSRQKMVIRMDQEFSSLKWEVVYLRESLQNSVCHQDILKRRLKYFEEREESELIRQSIDHENSRDAIVRHHKYVKFAPRNFSRGFVKSHQSPH